MKQILFFFVLTVAVFAGLAAQEAAQSGAELTFTFTRQSGAASNQFAVWVEDAQGQHIKTIYATRYTANGGYKRRETSIPTWVKKSGLADMTKTQVDALTGATPKNGTLAYTWDGTNSKGAAVPAGEYIICLEATLRWETQALYRASITTGKDGAVAKPRVDYTGTPGNEKEMISDFTVKVLR